MSAATFPVLARVSPPSLSELALSSGSASSPLSFIQTAPRPSCFTPEPWLGWLGQRSTPQLLSYMQIPSHPANISLAPPLRPAGTRSHHSGSYAFRLQLRLTPETAVPIRPKPLPGRLLRSSSLSSLPAETALTPIRPSLSNATLSRTWKTLALLVMMTFTCRRMSPAHTFPTTPPRAPTLPHAALDPPCTTPTPVVGRSRSTLTPGRV